MSYKKINVCFKTQDFDLGRDQSTKEEVLSALEYSRTYSCLLFSKYS